MGQYTIYCTAEQTKKAFELGAPIKEAADFDEDTTIIYSQPFYEIYGFLPTAEQMISWLEEQDIAIDITMASKNTSYYTLTRLTDIGAIYIKGRSENDYTSRKEATLAAIDAALEYLADNNLIK